MAVVDDLPALGDELERSYQVYVFAWRMVVPKKLAHAYDLTHPNGPG